MGLLTTDDMDDWERMQHVELMALKRKLERTTDLDLRAELRARIGELSGAIVNHRRNRRQQEQARPS